MSFDDVNDGALFLARVDASHQHLTGSQPARNASLGSLFSSIHLNRLFPPHVFVCPLVLMFCALLCFGVSFDVFSSIIAMLPLLLSLRFCFFHFNSLVCFFEQVCSFNSIDSYHLLCVFLRRPLCSFFVWIWCCLWGLVCCLCSLFSSSMFTVVDFYIDYLVYCYLQVCLGFGFYGFYWLIFDATGLLILLRLAVFSVLLPIIYFRSVFDCRANFVVWQLGVAVSVFSITFFFSLLALLLKNLCVLYDVLTPSTRAVCWVTQHM